jgi:hypothetical protein
MKRLVLLAVCPLVLLCLTVQAQAMRDPTLAPAMPGTSDGVGKAAPSLPEGPLSVVIVAANGYVAFPAVYSSITPIRIAARFTTRY